MAVDTLEKRFSMINFGSVSTDMLFEADGTVDADDKSHLLDLYSGIALASPAATTLTTYFYNTLLAGG